MLTALLRIRKDLQLLSALLRHHGSAFVDLTNHGWKKNFFFLIQKVAKKQTLNFPCQQLLTWYLQLLTYIYIVLDVL